MPTIVTTDGTEIFYKDWGSGQPIVFSHGWPLSGDDWDAQMMFVVNPATTAPRAAELVANGTLKTYPGFPHGMPTTHADVINPDLLTFIQS